MKQFPNKEEKLKKRDDLIKKADTIMQTVDQNAVERVIDRRYLGETENDNKLLQFADSAHMERQIEAFELLLEADKYNED